LYASQVVQDFFHKTYHCVDDIPFESLRALETRQRFFLLLLFSKEVLFNQLHLRVQQSQCLGPSKRWNLISFHGEQQYAQGSYLGPSLTLWPTESRPFQKETSVPTNHFLMLCKFQGGEIIVVYSFF